MGNLTVQKQPASSPVTADPNQPDQQHSSPPPTVAERLSYLPSEWDVGEQIVATSHVFEMQAPFNGGSTTATLTATISGNEAFSVESIPASIEPVSATSSHDVVSEQLQKRIRVRFTPAEINHRRSAALTITAKWPDGISVVRIIELSGDARGINDAPAPTKEERINASESRQRQEANIHADVEAKKFYDSDRHLERPPAWAEDKYRDHKDRADLAARDIALKQQDAITELIAKIGTYTPPPAPPDVWWELAKMAILLGSSVVGGFVVGVLAEKIAVSLLTAGERATSFAKGLSGSVAGKMQSAAAGALAGVHVPAPEIDQPNKRIAFFEAQWEGFEAVARENGKMILEQSIRGRPVLGQNPQLAVDTMGAIADGFEQASPHAKAAQASAGATAWLAYKARMELGAAKLGDGTYVTNLDRTRKSKHPTPDGFRGLMDLVVDVDHGPPHVSIARAPGVARALIGDIGMMNLAEAKLPLRVFVGWNEPDPTIITRDEAGRVRVSGNFQRLSKFAGPDDKITNEAQAEQAARTVVDLAMSRSLNDWGVSIATDDASKE